MFQRLLDLSNANGGSMKLTALVRTQSAADKFNTLGDNVHAVVGSLDIDNDDEVKLLGKLASEIDIVLSMVCLLVVISVISI